MEESGLIEALKQRDPQALSQVFEAHADKIYRLAISQLHDEQQADGVVQNTFMRLIEHIDTFEGRSRISTWLYRVAYNECMMRLRQSKRPRVEIDAMDEEQFMPENMTDWDTVPDKIVSGNEAQQQMHTAINSLSPALRAVFIMRDVEEFSVKQTADALDISETAVKVRLHRARLILREKLADYFSDQAQV